MSDFDEPWPKEMLIPEDSGFFRRALAVAKSSASSLTACIRRVFSPAV
jgi:hypothetical protein